MIGARIEHSDALLDAARQVGDEAADAIVARLGRDVWRVNGLLGAVIRNDEALPAALPQDLRSFLEANGRLPRWVDRTRILRAQRWADAHVFHITTALFFASLPTAYAAERGARVLVATGRMQGDLVRRLSETSHFVLAVIAPGSFEPSGSAIRACQKVRLVHAAVREVAKARGLVEDEVPVNQEDLLGTMLTFSLAVIHALRRLGIEVASREAEDYLHLWTAVGALLGIREELLPRDLASAESLGLRIAARHFRASEHGRLLMATLLARTREPLRLPWLDDAPSFLTRYLVGDWIADLLDVPVERGFPRAVRKLARVPGLGLASAHAVLQRLSAQMGRPLLLAVSQIELRGERPSFSMPVGGALASGRPGAPVR